MGIQLTDHERRMIKQIANYRRNHLSPTPYLFGYLRARVDSAMRKAISLEQLIADAALIDLLETLYARCSPDELDGIAAGTRELPGEDVHSVR